MVEVEKEVTRTNLRVLGIGFFFILSGIGGFLLWKGLTITGVVLLGAGMGFGGVGVFAPFLLKPVYGPWMVVAEKLGRINTVVLLAAIYYLAITPIGLVMRLVGKNPLDRGKRRAKSYWKKTMVRSHEHFERQF